MPDSSQPKTPPAEPHTETSPKESIRPAQEEFVGDEATPSRDQSEYEEDRGSQSSDRAVEDASLSNMAGDVAEADEEDDDDLNDDEDDLDDTDDEGGSDDEEELADGEETESTPGAARALVAA